jgi:hypothetical protein
VRVDLCNVLFIANGAAGRAVANNLVRHNDKTIPVLEAGPIDSNQMIRIPGGLYKLLAKDAAAWPCETVPINAERRKGISHASLS